MFTSVSKIVLVASLFFATSLASSSDSGNSGNSVSSESSDSNDNQLDPVTIRFNVDVSANAMMDMVASVTADLTAPAPEDVPTSDFDLDFDVMTVADVTVDIDSTPNGASSETIVETPVNVEMRIDVTNGMRANQVQDAQNGQNLDNVLFQEFREFDGVDTVIDINVMNANDPDNVEVQENTFTNRVTRVPSVLNQNTENFDAAGDINGNVRSEASYAVIADGNRVAGNNDNQDAVINDVSQLNRRRMQSPDPVTLSFTFQVDSEIMEAGQAVVDDNQPLDTQVLLNLVVKAVSISEVTFDYSGVSGSFDNRQVNLEIDLNVTARATGTGDETATREGERMARIRGDIDGFSVGYLRMMVLDITDPDNVEFLEPEVTNGVEISDVNFETTMMGNPGDIEIATSFEFERVTGDIQLNTDVDTAAAPFVAERAVAEQAQKDLSDGNEDGDKVVIETIVLSQDTKMNLYAMLFVIVLACCVCGSVLWFTRNRQMKQRVAFDDRQADVIGV